jgi:hypothetical protein
MQQAPEDGQCLAGAASSPPPFDAVMANAEPDDR